MLNVWDRWSRPPFKRQEICERKMCVTVPFTTPYSVNIVWVSCLCVLWEGARQSNAYRHMQSERNGWLAVMANKHIIHSADPRDSIWICLQSESVCGAMCYACCFLCVYCVKWLHIRWTRLVWITASLPWWYSTGTKRMDLYFQSEVTVSLMRAVNSTCQITAHGRRSSPPRSPRVSSGAWKRTCCFGVFFVFLHKVWKWSHTECVLQEKPSHTSGLSNALVLKAKATKRLGVVVIIVEQLDTMFIRDFTDEEMHESFIHVMFRHIPPCYLWRIISYSTSRSQRLRLRCGGPRFKSNLRPFTARHPPPSHPLSCHSQTVL